LLQTKLMVAHVCDQKYRPFWQGIALFCICPLNSALALAKCVPVCLFYICCHVRPRARVLLCLRVTHRACSGSAPVPELALLVFVATVAALSLVHYSVYAIRELADALQIKVFKIIPA
jgi:hypothetical protein